MNNSSDGVRSPGADGYFEWWYFDFQAGDRGLARIEWHAPLFNLRDRACVLVLRHYDHQQCSPGQGSRPLVRGARYPRSRVEMDQNRCRIRFPAGRISEEGDGYSIRIEEQEFAADLELTRLLPPVTRPDGEIIRTADGAETFGWTIPLPRARAAGTFTLDGTTVPVDGPAYHDHNWGNLHLGRRLRRWIWFRVLFDDLTLIFARIEMRREEEPVHQLIVLDREGRRMDMPAFEVELSDERDSASGPLRYPATIRIRFGRDPEYVVRLEVPDRHTVEEEPLGALGSRRLDNLYARLWYLAGQRRIPRLVRRRAGRLLYLQAMATARLSIDGSETATRQGVLEVFHCEP